MLASIALVAALGPNTPPRWLDDSIAGYVLTKREDAAVVDTDTGYMIVRSGECDWGNVNLLLTRDRKLVDEHGVNVPGVTLPDSGHVDHKLKAGRLSTLSTGNGVAIGDTPARVLDKLGRPSKREVSGEKSQFVDWTYEWAPKKGPEESGPRYYNQRYTFKGDKLIEISFSTSRE